MILPQESRRKKQTLSYEAITVLIQIWSNRANLGSPRASVVCATKDRDGAVDLTPHHYHPNAASNFSQQSNMSLLRAASSLSRTRGTLLHRSTQPFLQSIPRRTLATHEPEIAWSDYRSGKVTFQQWVDGNRYIVAGSMFAFYVGLGVYLGLRPKKEKKGVVEVMEGEKGISKEVVKERESAGKEAVEPAPTTTSAHS